MDVIDAEIEKVLAAFEGRPLNTRRMVRDAFLAGSMFQLMQFANRPSKRKRIATPPTEPACQPTLTECPRCKNDFRACPMTQEVTDAQISEAWKTVDPNWPVTSLGLRFARAVLSIVATPPAKPAPQAKPAAVGALPTLPELKPVAYTDIGGHLSKYSREIQDFGYSPIPLVSRATALEAMRDYARAALASAQPVREPLTDDQVRKAYREVFDTPFAPRIYGIAEAFARAVERAHGIG